MKNLKWFGQWSSNTCSEGYIDNSTKMKTNYLSFLGRTLSDSLTKKRNTEKSAKRTNEEHHKKPKLEKCGNSLSIETHETTVVYNNCAMYSDSNMISGAVPPPAPLHAPPKNNQNLLSFYIKKWVSLVVMKKRISFKLSKMKQRIKTEKEYSLVIIVFNRQICLCWEVMTILYLGVGLPFR